MKKVTFLIDGFNLYHSCRNARDDLGGVQTKWLNICSLCQSLLPIIGGGASLYEIFYFSALAKHLLYIDPDIVVKHENYIECLKDTGIVVELSKFKRKEKRCKLCHQIFITHEEKQTDVAIATKLIELALLNSCDTIIIMSGDTDLIPAIKSVKARQSHIEVRCAFPYKTKSGELSKVLPGSFRIMKERYPRHQFSDPYKLSDGRNIQKPISW